MLSMVKRIIEMHISDPEICKIGCNVFNKIFSGMDGKQIFYNTNTHLLLLRFFKDEHRERVNGESYIEIVLKVMEKHSDPDTRMNGCGALSNIVRGNGKYTRIRCFLIKMNIVNNQDMAREAGCIGFVLNMVSEHIENVDICRCGCGALLNLVSDNGTREYT